jgi:hypothetical protein
MRELDFLPGWYPQLQRKKRILVLQLWMTLVMVLGTGAWYFQLEQSVAAAQERLRALDSELAQSDENLRQLQEQVEFKNRLRLQEQIVARLGVSVEMTRLLHLLQAAMPREMSLVEMSLDTREQTRPISTAAAARAGANRETLIERSLQVKVVGVAPNDSDIATLLSGLNSMPFLKQVALSYARDRVDEGHLMREFEISFTMELNQAAGQ